MASFVLILLRLLWTIADSAGFVLVCRPVCRSVRLPVSACLSSSLSSSLPVCRSVRVTLQESSLGLASST
eukprot:749415-Hanusia_phi.AAC.2